MFEARPQDPVFLITQGTWGLLEGIPQHLAQVDTDSRERQPIWEIIGSITGWHIWTSQCAQILGDTSALTAQIMADI